MRKQFEVWFKDKKHHVVAEEVAWQAWQASRAALVVELPGWDDFDTTKQVLSAVIEDLKSEGITVKEK